MPLVNSNLIVITGGPGAGKTTVLSELSNQGFACAPEVARKIIQEQVECDGTALPWKDRELYTRVMLQRSIDSFHAHLPATRPTFCDRGIPDTLGYARLIEMDDAFIRTACVEYRYAPLVFAAPPWAEIYATDTERKQGFAEAERTFKTVTAVYRECGYRIIELPFVTPSERAAFMIRHLRRESLSV
jgi:predicted ATPase